LHAYRVSVCPLCRSPAGCPVGAGCGVPTPSPSTASNDAAVFLLRLRLLFRVSPVHRGGHRFSQPASRLTNPLSAPSEVSRPFSVFPVVRSHLTRRIPNPPVTLRPQGFAPSRRFAPRATCRAYSIPVPLLGLTPRGFDPRATPYAVSGAGPLLGFLPASRRKPVRPSRGSAHRAKPDHDTRGLAR
jgi:hypothetical protein